MSEPDITAETYSIEPLNRDINPNKKRAVDISNSQPLEPIASDNNAMEVENEHVFSSETDAQSREQLLTQIIYQ